MFRRVLGRIRRWPVPFVALLSALGGGAMAAPALADTTIGQIGFTNPAPAICLAGPVALADTNYVVPSGGGWITDVSYETTTAGGTELLDFLVLRPAQGNYTVVGVTDDVMIFEAGGVQSFSPFVGGNLRFIPVQGGDILGFYVPGSLPGCARGGLISGGGFISSTVPASPPIVGGTVSLPGGDPTLDLNLSANLVTVPECHKFRWRYFGFKSQHDCLVFVRAH
jgi:hypothetical protein